MYIEAYPNLDIAVYRIVGDGIPKVLQMHTYLMRC